MSRQSPSSHGAEERGRSVHIVKLTLWDWAWFRILHTLGARLGLGLGTLATVLVPARLPTCSLQTFGI